MLFGLLAAMLGCSRESHNDFTLSDHQAHAVNLEPAWGPDGARIAYVHYPQTLEEQNNGFEQIWVGTLTSAGKFISRGSKPTWSPDGRSLAFVRDFEIWRVDLDSGVETQLTFQGACLGPAWSPDGVHIAYRNQADSPIPPADSAGIWMVDAGTLERKLLTRTPGWHPTWAPSGDRIAFTTGLVESGDFHEEIAILNPVSGGVARLTSDANFDRAPAWSPDGSSIAWYSHVPGNRSLDGIWLMEADGTSPHLLIHDGGYPSWSPDGKFIAWGGYNSQTNIQSLWVASADGSGARELPY
jgi:Tol biopolymer transport system component